MIDLYMMPDKLPTLALGAVVKIPQRGRASTVDPRRLVAESPRDRQVEQACQLRHRIDTLAKWIAEHERVRARYHWQSDLWRIETLHIRFLNTTKLRFERQYEDLMKDLETAPIL